MVRVLKLKKEQAQKAKEFLIQKGWLATSIQIGRSALRYVLLPINENADIILLKKEFTPSSIEERNLKPLPPVPGNLKNLLQGVIPEKKIDDIIKSYDVVGDICILEIPKGMEKYEVGIGHAIKRAFPNIKVIARKAGKREEIERVMPLKIITGEKRFETEHKEYGVTMKVNLSKVYFSPRASKERYRIAQLVKKNEKVLVMFGGVAPYALVIAKVQPFCQVWSVEINEDAHKLAEDNIRINRAGHIITSILGDANEVLPQIGGPFDRIIMPMPLLEEEKGFDFLKLAAKHSSPSAVIHFFAFVHEQKLDEMRKKIEAAIKESGRNGKVQNWRLFGTYAPYVNRYVFDVLVR